jgi:hypothetical protein
VIPSWCFRNQLLLIHLQLLLAKALAANFDLTGSCEAKFGCNLFLSKALDRSHQQLITEAPASELQLDSQQLMTEGPIQQLSEVYMISQTAKRGRKRKLQRHNRSFLEFTLNVPREV